jgi:hypothetical protein
MRTPADGSFSFRVEEPDAFPSFAAPADALRVREILSHPASGSDKRSRRHLPRNHAISLARCAFEIAPGKRCGHIIRAFYPAALHGQYRYVGSCHGNPIPHSRWVPAILDEVVLDILLEVFRPERLRAGLERIRVEEGALKGRRAALENQVVHLEAHHEAASSLVLSAQRDGKAAEVNHWRGKMEQLRQDLVRAESELRQIREDERHFQEARTVDMKRILALGSDLPELVRRACKVEGMLRQIVDTLTESIHVMCVGRAMFEVEVRFPAGASVRRVFFGGHFRCSHAARVWAYQRLRQSILPADVAAEISAATTGERKWIAWSPSRVLGAAALHEHLETVRPRGGLHRTEGELARELELETKEVLRAALKGRLGPARWGEDGLLLQPTTRDLHTAFPTYARRDVCRRTGWDDAEVIVLRRHSQFPKAMLRSAMIERDEAGRVYARTASLPADWELSRKKYVAPRGRPLEEVVAELGRPEYQAGDFVPLREVRGMLNLPSGYPSPAALYQGIRSGSVTRVYAIAPNGWRTYKQRTAYVYVPPHIRSAPSDAAVRAWLRPDKLQGRHPGYA